MTMVTNMKTVSGLAIAAKAGKMLRRAQSTPRWFPPL